MKSKKTPQADLESKRKVFLQLGFVITLSVMLMAFEWGSQSGTIMMLTDAGNVIESDWNELVLEDMSKNIERPKPEVKQTEILEIYVDTEPLTDDLDFSSETDQKEKMKAVDTYFEPEVEDEIWSLVEDMPLFRPAINKTKAQGDADLFSFIARNVKYPKEASELGIMGKVWVSFVVNKKGKVCDVQLARSVDSILDDEALRVILSLPDFRPGRQMTELVNVKYTVPINFVLK